MYSFFKTHNQNLPDKEELTQADIDAINARNMGITMHNSREHTDLYLASLRFFRAMEAVKERNDPVEMAAMRELITQGLEGFIEEHKDILDNNSMS